MTLKENLRLLTIPPWLEQISSTHQSPELAPELRVWCPTCFQVWLDSEQPIYEPLIWSIAAVTICPHHHQPLQSRCPHCQRTQRPITSKMQVGRCAHCLGWLNALSKELAEAEQLIKAEMEWHLWVAERVIEVLASIPRIPSSATRDAIAYVIYSDEQQQVIYPTQSLVKLAQRNLLEAFAQWID